MVNLAPDSPTDSYFLRLEWTPYTLQRGDGLGLAFLVLVAVAAIILADRVAGLVPALVGLWVSGCIIAGAVAPSLLYR